jgi:addiction module RelE/StbE family toxin
MIVEYTKTFSKRYDKAPAKIRLAFANRLELFEQNPFDPILNNHSLSGKYANSRSINITGDWRAIFQTFDNYESVSFSTIGTHSQLYKK